jgi:hypothetical protein
VVSSHAERLMGEPPFERIDHQEMPVAARNVSTSTSPAAGITEQLGLQAEPFADRRGQRRPMPRIGQHAAHPLGQMRRQRELAAGVGWNLGLGGRCCGIPAPRSPAGLEAHNLAGEGEGVADGELLDEGFLQLTQHELATRTAGRGVPALCRERRHDQADLDQSAPRR